MLHIWTSKRRCMCMHRAALSWMHSKCDISGERQPCCAHTERLIFSCTITTAHPECLSTAHVHNVCTEHALRSPLLQGPDKNTFCGRKLLVLPFALKTLNWYPHFGWGHTQDWSVPASQSSPCSGLPPSSFQTPMLHCIFRSVDRNMTDLITCG